MLAKEVRKITGFERVMVYRFDEHWNGIVIAEEKPEYLTFYLGLHYPASEYRMAEMTIAIIEASWGDRRQEAEVNKRMRG